MAGFDNDTVYGTNVDFSGAGAGQGGNPTLLTNGQMLIGTTALNAGGTHINVGTITSPLGTLSIGYSSPNITIDLVGGTTAIEKINLQTGTTPIVPSAGAITFNGAVVAAGTNPVRTDGTGANTMALEVQISQALAAADATKIGLSNFDSSSFAVAATGFVTLSTTGAGKTITGNDLVALSPTANNWNIVGTGSTITSGSVSTLTVQLTGLTNHAILVGAGTATITKVGPSATTGQIFQSQGSTTDPAFSTATYPSTTTINQILYSSAANTVTGLSTVNNGVLITSATGVPSLLPDGTTGQVLTATTGSPPSWANPATSGTVTSVSVVTANGLAGTVANPTTTPAITLSTTVTGVLSGNGTAISGSAVTQFDVLVGGTSNAITSIGPGSTGQVLQSGGAASNPAYSTATYPSTATSTGTILRADGTNWTATTATYPNTTTSQQILYSTANNVIGELTTANSKLPATNASGTLAMRAFSINVQVFSSSGTYTPTTGMLYCLIECVGGGGGGGGAAATNTVQIACAGGGGSGGYARGKFSSATIGASQTVTIGAAGTAGAAGANNGGTGGTTSVGALISSTGGVGGNGATANTASSFQAGGGGGAGSSGDFQTTGAAGGNGMGAISAGIFSFAVGGFGGSSFFGGGAINTNAAGAGAAGNSFGGGGGGAANLNTTASAAAGGAGVKGVVVVTEYIIN